MTLTLEEVEHIAALARLELSPEEKELFRRQLSAILEYAAQVQAVALPEAPLAAGLLETGAGLRADEARPGLTRPELLANAPDSQAGQLRVPPALE